MRLRLACTLLLALMLAGCQTPIPNYIAMPAPAKSQIASTDVVLPIRQAEIYVFVPASNITAATGGGLLWALVDAGVDSVRTSKAETAVKPLRDALVDYSFDRVVSGKMKEALAGVSYLNVTGVQVTKDLASIAPTVAGAKSDAVMVGCIDYKLDNDGKVLTVNMGVNVYPKTDALKALRTQKPQKEETHPLNALYRNFFTFTKTPPDLGPKADRDAYIAAWSADKGAMMRAALDEAADSLAKQLAADF